MMNFSALTPDQQIEAQYLFADSVFGTVSSIFDYETDKDGHVTGRTPLDPSTNTTRMFPGSGLRVHGLVIPNPSADQSARADAVLTMIAHEIVTGAVVKSVRVEVDA